MNQTLVPANTFFSLTDYEVHRVIIRRKIYSANTESLASIVLTAGSFLVMSEPVYLKLPLRVCGWGYLSTYLEIMTISLG